MITTTAATTTTTITTVVAVALLLFLGTAVDGCIGTTKNEKQVAGDNRRCRLVMLVKGSSHVIPRIQWGFNTRRRRPDGHAVLC
ncbi:hypothetical protein BX666DRAFT_1964816 [Dichotomocladium elegans]|nr:hypothetical protein BX666DRAFT_1964816 [Dichotomocladium elegans]